MRKNNFLMLGCHIGRLVRSDFVRRRQDATAQKDYFLLIQRHLAYHILCCRNP